MKMLVFRYNLKINDQFDSAATRKSHIFAKIALWVQNKWSVLETYKKRSKWGIFEIFARSPWKNGFELVIVSTEPPNTVLFQFATIFENLFFFPLFKIRDLKRKSFGVEIFLTENLDV